MNSLFEDALDIPVWLERDRALAFRERTHRDRQLGLDIREASPLVRVRAWWRQVDADARPGLGAKLQRTRAWLSLLLCGTGALFGAGLALAVLSYDGHYPVNVVAALALLVIAPLLLMVASLLLMPGRVRGLRLLQDVVAAVNVGNLAASVFNRFASPQGELKLDWGGARGGPLARLAKWQVMFFSQLAGLSFSLAATATAFALVVFTDLAFGWSTTLDVATGQAHRLIEAVSWPWRQWAPDAVPSLVLVEESRFFRLDSGDSSAVAAGRLTGWWPFLLMSLLTYGVLPRCVLLLVARARLGAATRDALLEDVGVRALLDRMDSAVLDSDGDGQEPPVAPLDNTAADAAVRLAGSVRVLAWNLAGQPELVDGWLAAHVENLHSPPMFVGGDNELAVDEQALTAFSRDDSTRVVILVKGWEPPLLDCMDVLRSLRGRVGDDVSLVVVPLGLDVGAPETNELDAWHHAVSKLADPGTYVEAMR